MISRLLIAAVLFGSMLSSPVLAGGPPAPAAGGQPANVHVSSFTLPNDLADRAQAVLDAFAPPPTGTYIDLPSMNVPVVRSDQLAGYAFIIVRVHFNDGVDDWRVREKSHHMLDSAVRAVHRTPFVYLGREGYDDTAAHAALVEVVRAYLPANGLKNIELLGGDISLLAR